MCPPGRGLGGTGSAGGPADDLDAAVEARIPRYWVEIERICPSLTYRPCTAFPIARRISVKACSRYDVECPNVTLIAQNEARRVLFDSFAEYVLRSAGTPVWDIGGFSVSTYGLSDVFHMDGRTMRELNLDMAERILC